MPTATLTGTFVDADDQPRASVPFVLTLVNSASSAIGIAAQIFGTLDGSGDMSVTGLMPGSYTLTINGIDELSFVIPSAAAYNVKDLINL